MVSSAHRTIAQIIKVPHRDGDTLERMQPAEEQQIQMAIKGLVQADPDGVLDRVRIFELA
jgi:hypothetical protein